MYGSLLFVGLFFVALFLITTVLIIYYKQITEGYEDRQRFRIMRQVGLSDAEVRTSIRRQVQMVFFLPIIVALVHIAFAFPALQKIMTLFEMAQHAALYRLCGSFRPGVPGLLYRSLSHHRPDLLPHRNLCPPILIIPIQHKARRPKGFPFKTCGLCVFQKRRIRTFPAKVPSYRCHDGSAYL